MFLNCHNHYHVPKSWKRNILNFNVMIDQADAIFCQILPCEVSSAEVLKMEGKSLDTLVFSLTITLVSSLKSFIFSSSFSI